MSRKIILVLQKIREWFLRLIDVILGLFRNDEPEGGEPMSDEHVEKIIIKPGKGCDEESSNQEALSCTATFRQALCVEFEATFTAGIS